jgi:ribonuclease P/MRP protein subunit RPP40
LLVDLILPESIAELLHAQLIEGRPQPDYSRVIMSLGDVLTGDFFMEYIKAGNILMLSETRAADDNIFTLHQGEQSHPSCLLLQI